MDDHTHNIDGPEMPVRVLVVTDRSALKRRLGVMLDGRVESLRFVPGKAGAEQTVSNDPCDLVIIDNAAEAGDGIAVLEEISKHTPGVSGVVIVEAPTADQALRAMRAGACDLISPRTRTGEVLSRVRSAARRARANRSKDERVTRLRRLCHTLRDARTEVSGQVGGLCNDLVDAYRDLSEQMTDVRLTAELGTLLRQELEIEGLLRTALEFTLSKLGPTNAAVFLPSSSGEFSLGAYVNHDVPRDQAEVMLDHLADTLAPSFEDCEGIACLEGDQAHADAMFGESHWLENRTTLVYSCRRDEECLAVLALFRDEGRPFSEQDVRTATIVGSLFAAQLERVIRTHHRHLPKDQWESFGNQGFEDDGQDDFGADDLGFDDFGGLAA